MTNRHFIWALVWWSAAVAITGCKGSSTADDARADADDGVRVLEKGDRPRTELRYNIRVGTTTTSTTTFRAATLAATPDETALSVLPGLRFDVVSGPAGITERGVRFQIDVVRSEAIVPKGFDPEMAAQLRKTASVVDEIGGWIEMDDRGRMLAGQFNEQTKRSDLPLRLLRAIVNARQTLTRVRLPREKVGLGARWETHRVIDAYGFHVEQVNTYTLVDRAGDEIMLNVHVEQMAAPQTIEFPDEGLVISVESLSGSEDGQIILDLDALESDASATGQLQDHLVVKSDEGTQTVQVVEEYEIQVANTTALIAE